MECETQVEVKWSVSTAWADAGESAYVNVPRMSALFFHRPPVYERATDHKYTKGCSHLGKKCGQDQV